MGDAASWVEFEVWQGGMSVAAASAPNRHDALREIQHYARVYAQDGRIQVFEVSRRRLSADELNADPRPVCVHCGEHKDGTPTGLCNHCHRFAPTTDREE